MADTKISAMTAATTLADTDELVLASSGANKKITGANLKASIPGTGGGGAMTLLSTTTLASNGTFNVSSISGSYNDLKLVAIIRSARASASDSLLLQLNGDTGSNYASQFVQGSGSTASALELGLGTSINLRNIPGTTATTPNTFGVFTIYIAGYASTTWVKTVIAHNAYISDVAAGTSSKQINVYAAIWNSTAAITSVQLFGNSVANLVTGSQLRIYGIT